MADTKTHFSDVKFMAPEDCKFTVKGLSVPVANAFRRAIMNEIPLFTISPETIKFEKNTSPWDPEILTHKLVFLPLKQDLLAKHDINMLELMLHVRNDTSSYRWVYAGEMQVINKETNAKMPMGDILRRLDTPLFELGPNQSVDMTASFEQNTKVAARGQDMAARFQAATAAYGYDENPKDPSLDPLEYRFNVALMAGYEPKRHMSLALSALIARLENIHAAIAQRKRDKFYLQMNRYHRYDFVLLDETNTMGNMISSWIRRYDVKVFAASREIIEKNAITIDYGLFRFSPPILIEKSGPTNVQSVLDKSFKQIDPKKETEQRETTIGTFLEHLKRIQSFLKELKKEWDKIRVVNVSVKDYLTELNATREQLRQKIEKKVLQKAEAKTKKTKGLPNEPEVLTPVGEELLNAKEEEPLPLAAEELLDAEEEEDTQELP